VALCAWCWDSTHGGRVIAQLGTRDFFSEMALLAGE
jgi:hypothetical protein